MYHVSSACDVSDTINIFMLINICVSIYSCNCSLGFFFNLLYTFVYIIRVEYSDWAFRNFVFFLNNLYLFASQIAELVNSLSDYAHYLKKNLNMRFTSSMFYM